MNKQDMIKWLSKQKNNEKMPRYIEVDNVNHMQVMINGNWSNVVYSWGILFIKNRWIYFETDDERGYVFHLKHFSNEQEVCEYAQKSFKIKLCACN